MIRCCRPPRPKLYLQASQATLPLLPRLFEILPSFIQYFPLLVFPVNGTIPFVVVGCGRFKATAPLPDFPPNLNYLTTLPLMILSAGTEKSHHHDIRPTDSHP